jgi:ferredoxin
MEGYLVNNHQLKYLLELIARDHLVYLPQKKDGRIVFDLIENVSDIRVFSKTTLPFKKVLFSNGSTKTRYPLNNKIALVGLHNCDVAALELFYQQFSESDILPPRSNLLIIGSECKPDDDCFCNVFGTDKLGNVDFYLQKEKDQISIFSQTPKARKYFAKLGVKESANKCPYRLVEIISSEINREQLEENVDAKRLHKEFWQGIANNCFGCGACTTVCPLCFCFRREYKNDINGGESQCLKWDSCFAKEFSEVQNHFDLRPNNVDRLYNWYHHKFVRAEKELDKSLCVGCGRCIKACPAHLNIKNILRSLQESSD